MCAPLLARTSKQAPRIPGSRPFPSCVATYIFTFSQAASASPCHSLGTRIIIMFPLDSPPDLSIPKYSTSSRCRWSSARCLSAALPPSSTSRVALGGHWQPSCHCQASWPGMQCSSGFSWTCRAHLPSPTCTGSGQPTCWEHVGSRQEGHREKERCCGLRT